MATHWPSGLLTALVTPLTEGSVDLGALRHLLDSQLESGVTGVVVGGGTGEFGSLSLEERRTLAEAVIDHVDRRLTVVVQTGCLATRDVLELSRHAEGSGADGLLIASPFGEAITWQERQRFYETVSESVSTPIMIYNTPPSGILTLPQIQALAGLDHISAIKDSSGDHELLGDIVAWASEAGVAVYVGKDTLVYDGVVAGAQGAVLGVANFVAEPLAALLSGLQTEGPSAATLAAWRSLRPILRFLEDSSNYVALCKVGCRLRGLDVGDVRAPYLMPDADEVRDFEHLVAGYRALAR